MNFNSKSCFKKVFLTENDSPHVIAQNSAVILAVLSAVTGNKKIYSKIVVAARVIHRICLCGLNTVSRLFYTRKINAFKKYKSFEQTFVNCKILFQRKNRYQVGLGNINNIY